MPIEILAGPPGSGKSSALIDALCEPIPPSRRLLVVPDRQTAAEFRRHLLDRLPRNASAIRSASILDWPSLVAELASPAQPRLRQPQAALLTHRILAGARLSCFGSRSKSPGLAHQFAEAIAALKANGVDPDRLRSIIDGCGADARRERDLLEIYSLYEKERAARGLLDDACLPGLALHAVREGRAPLLAGLDAIFFDEFHCLSPGQLALIAAIREALPLISIRVAFPTATPASPHAGLFFEYLLRGRAALGRIADREASLPARPQRDPSVRILCTRSPAQEARTVVQVIASLAAEGCPPPGIVVAARGDDPFLEHFLAEADAMGLLPRHPSFEAASQSPFTHELLAPDAIEGLPEQATVGTFLDFVRRRATEGGRVASWSMDLARHPAARGGIGRNLFAVSALLEALRRIESTANLVGLEAISREDFIRILSDELCSPAPLGALDAALPFRFLPFGTPLALSAEAVIVPRLIEGHIPRPAPERPFFTEWDDALISGIFPGPADAHASEAWAFETLIAKCHREATLLYPAVDEGGGETLRSAFVDRFLPPEAAPEFAPPIVPRSAAAEDADWEERLVRTIAVERARATGSAAVAGFMGNLSTEESRRRIAERFTGGEIRVTALERYAACPFAFFVEHVLMAEELEEETPEMHPRDRGTMVHELLKRFYEIHAQEAIAARSSPSAAKALPSIVHALADQVWEAHRDEVQKVAPGLRDRQRTSIERMVLQVVNAEIDEAQNLTSPLTPAACEWPFGRREGRPFLLPIAGEEPAALSGRVDRIDMSEDQRSFLVLDYKTGSVKAVINRIREGDHLQLPLYVEAVRRLFAPKARPLGALIIDVQHAKAEEKKTEGKTSGIVRREFNDACYRVGGARSKVDDAGFEEAMAAAQSHAAACVAAIRGGRFSPRACEACRKCIHGDICRQKNLAAD